MPKRPILGWSVLLFSSRRKGSQSLRGNSKPMWDRSLSNHLPSTEDAQRTVLTVYADSQRPHAIKHQVPTVVTKSVRHPPLAFPPTHQPLREKLFSTACTDVLVSGSVFGWGVGTQAKVLCLLLAQCYQVKDLLNID